MRRLADVRARARGVRLWLVVVGSMFAMTFAAHAQTAPDPPVPTSAPVPLTTLVDRYFAWRGGAAFDALHRVHYHGGVTVGGVQENGDYWIYRDGRTREADDYGGGVKVLNIATPTAAWSVNVSGQVLAAPDAARTVLRYAALEFGDALRGRDGAKAALYGTATNSQGHVFSVVRVTFGDADTYDLLLDPQTGALAAYAIDEAGVRWLVTLSDWRMVDGVRMPFRRVTGTEHSAAQALVSTSVELNPSPDDALFAAPPPGRLASFKGGATTSGWIDFQLFNHSQILIPVTVNGYATVALLDSGASASIIDRAYAAANSLSSAGGAIPQLGANGSQSGAFVTGVRVQIGELSLSSVTMHALDMQGLAQALGRPLPLVLGDEVFNELVVDIDFAHHRIAFRDPANPEIPPGAVQEPLTLDGSNRLTTLSIEGGPPMPVSFDLGADTVLAVFPTYAQRAHLPDGLRSSKEAYEALGGVATETIAVLPSVTFAGVTLRDPPTDFPPQNRSGLYSDRVQGVVGIGLLSRFRLSIDYPRDRLYALPDPSSIGTPFRKDRLGLAAEVQASDLMVVFIAPGSPTEAAGLKAGDRITAIDGRPVSTWSKQERDDLAASRPGTTVTLTLEGGATRSLVLADYF
jgi:hypothetical protein